MKAEEAFSCGFVNAVCCDFDQLMAHGERPCKTNSCILSYADKKVMLNYSRDNVADSLDYVATWQAGMLQVADMQEALQASKERRPSHFEDLYPRRSAIK